MISHARSKYFSDLAKKSHKALVKNQGKDFYKKIALKRWAKWHESQKEQEG